MVFLLCMELFVCVDVYSDNSISCVDMYVYFDVFLFYFIV